MKLYEFSFQTLLNAIRRQKRVLCIVACLFALLGIAAGFLYAHRNAAEAAGGADALLPVTVPTDPDDMDYYNDYYAALSEQYEDIKDYYEALSGISGLPNENAADLKEFRVEMTTIFKKQLTPISNRLEDTKAIYVPESYFPALITQYEEALESTQRELLAVEAASEIIKTMAAPAAGDGRVFHAYYTLLNRANQYADCLHDEDKYTRLLERLKNEPDTIIADCQELEMMENEAAQALNRLSEGLSTWADTMARASSLQLQTKYDENDTLSVTVTHTHSDVSAQDNFFLVWIFCTLVGICFGAFLAVCREAKKEKECTMDKED